MPKTKSARCDCRSLLLRRLFADFSAVGTPERREWEPMALAVLLGISEEHAIILLDLGLLEEAPGMPWRGPDQVSTAAILRFLEQDGAWLALLRVQCQLAVLRAQLTAERRRTRGRRRPAHGPARKRTEGRQ